MTQPNSITFPWQLLYSESMAVAGDLSRLDDRIKSLRYEADQLERGLRPVLAQRAEALRDATQRYEQQSRALAAKTDAEVTTDA